MKGGLWILFFVLVVPLATAQLIASDNSNFQSLVPGGSVTFTFDDPDVAITSIELFSPADAAANRGRLSVGETFVSNALRNELARNDREVYKYLLISPSSIAQRNVESMLITYEVDSAWTAANGDAVLLFATSSGWTELSQDQGVATAAQFGTYAIVSTSTPAVSAPPQPPDSTIPPIPPVPDSVPEPIFEEPELPPVIEIPDEIPPPEESRSFISILVLFVIIIGLVVLYLEIKHRPKIGAKKTSKPQKKRK